MADYRLPDELSEDIAMLFALGWDIRLERNYDGHPKIVAYKGTRLEFDYEERRGEFSGVPIVFHSREVLHRYAQMSETELKREVESDW